MGLQHMNWGTRLSPRHHPKPPGLCPSGLDLGLAHTDPSSTGGPPETPMWFRSQAAPSPWAQPHPWEPQLPCQPQPTGCLSSPQKHQARPGPLAERFIETVHHHPTHRLASAFRGFQGAHMAEEPLPQARQEGVLWRHSSQASRPSLTQGALPRASGPSKAVPPSPRGNPFTGTPRRALVLTGLHTCPLWALTIDRITRYVALSENQLPGPATRRPVSELCSTD